MQLFSFKYVFTYFILLLISQPCLSAKVRFVTEDMPPMQTIDENGNVVGINVELINEVLRVAELKSPIEILPWKRAFKDASTKPNTFIFGMVRNAERENKFVWVFKLNTLTSNLTALKTSKHIDLEKEEGILNYRVAVSRGEYGVDYLKSIGMVVDKNLYLTTNHRSMWRMLFKGRVDAVFTDNRTDEIQILDTGLSPSLTKQVWQFNSISSGVYLAAQIDSDVEIIEKLRKAHLKVLNKSIKVD